jgi:hypothetical protein
MDQNKPSSGQWADQQRKGMKKQKEVEKQNQQQNAQKTDAGHQQDQQGGAGAPQTTKLEPEKQGGIGGP